MIFPNKGLACDSEIGREVELLAQTKDFMTLSPDPFSLLVKEATEDYQLLFAILYPGVETCGSNHDIKKERIRTRSLCWGFNPENDFFESSLVEEITKVHVKYQRFGFLIYYGKQDRICNTENVIKLVIDAFSGYNHKKADTPPEYRLLGNDSYKDVPWVICRGTESEGSCSQTLVYVFGAPAAKSASFERECSSR